MKVKHIIIIGIVLMACVLMAGCVGNDFLNTTQNVTPQETIPLNEQHNNAPPPINYTIDKIVSDILKK